MKVSLQLACELYVGACRPPTSSRERLTSPGLEVEGDRAPGAALAGVVVAEVARVQRRTRTPTSSR